METRGRRGRETSPDRAKMCAHQRVKSPLRNVQVVYYLTRNGHLEHPHYMEVSLLPNQQLRLRDVMDRLGALRGKGVSSLYSWSYKRSYKNGYVWNDLAQNDLMYPTEGAEYVLKGSELVAGCTEKWQQLEINNSRTQGFETTSKPVLNLSSYPPQSRCSRGVSTDQVFDEITHNNNDEITLDDSSSSPPSATTSCTPAHSEKANESKRMEPTGGDIAMKGEAAVRGRNSNSVLLQLFSCGSSVEGAKGKNAPAPKEKSDSFRRGVVLQRAAKVAEEEMMISCMSENPRFGNLQSEEKEYFSGSIVEKMAMEEKAGTEPALKRSNSYNEERITGSAGAGEAADEDNQENAVKSKCIPLRNMCSKK